MTVNIILILLAVGLAAGFLSGMVGIGGGGNLLWAIGGALTLIAFPELLRFMNIPITVAAELRQIVFGVLLIVLAAAKGRHLVTAPLGKHT